MDNYSEITLDEITAIENISVRSKNVCGQNKLLTLQAILDYWQTYNSFKHLKNCGVKSERELTGICEKYGNNIIIITKIKKKLNIIETVASFDPSKKALLNHHITFLISKFDTPVKQAIVRLLGERDNAWEIIGIFNCNQSKLKQISGIGKRSLPKLLKFRKDIFSFVSILYEAEPTQFKIEYAKEIIRIYYEELPDNFDALYEQLVDVNGKIKLFKLIDILVRSDRLFNKNEKAIFTYVYTLTSKDLDGCTNELVVCKERILQIKNNLESNIKSYFPFFINMSLSDFSFADIELNGDLIIFNEMYANQNNQHADVNFNAALYAGILSIFLEPTHQLFTERIEIFPESLRKSRKNLHNCYLIKQELFAAFHFNVFLNFIDGITRERRYDDAIVPFLNWLEGFGINIQDQRFFRIKSICEMIIFHEYNLVLNPEGHLLLSANTRRPLANAIYEVLNGIGKISTLESIITLLTEKYPDLQFTRDSVKSTMVAQKTIFITIGKSATYGLKKWELENPYLKGGTMRDLVKVFLEESPVPVHTNDIFKYLQKYREISRRNVRINLRGKNETTFIFLEGGYIGLKSKKYLPENMASEE